MRMYKLKILKLGLALAILALAMEKSTAQDITVGIPVALKEVTIKIAPGKGQPVLHPRLLSPNKAACLVVRSNEYAKIDVFMQSRIKRTCEDPDDVVVVYALACDDDQIICSCSGAASCKSMEVICAKTVCDTKDKDGNCISGAGAAC